MKLILAGSTGFVATEILRQAVHNPAITSIIALARKETAVPKDAGSNASKVKSVVCDDFTNYSENVKKELAGANACIWTIAVTPKGLKSMPFEDVRKICFDYTVHGIETMTPLAAKPFRFAYISGVNGERDQTKNPWIMGDYAKLRGKTESYVLDYAKESKGAVEMTVAKPGIIEAPGHGTLADAIMRPILRAVVGLPKVENSEISATLIDQVVNGFEKETLLNEDLVTIGSKLLAGQKSRT